MINTLELHCSNTFFPVNFHYRAYDELKNGKNIGQVSDYVDKIEYII